MKSYIFILLVLVFSVSSCVSIALKSFGFDAKKANLKFIQYKGKSIYFVETRHIGTKNYYKHINSITDSLGKIGYVTFYESVEEDYIDTLFLKKFRKITGLDLTKKYLDTTNNLLADKFKISNKYVNQPKSSELISRNSKSFIIDIPLYSQIKKFEEDTEEIKLNECDLIVKLGEQYNCEPIKKSERNRYDKFMHEYVIEMRNKNLADQVINSEFNKIIIIYGKNHYKGFAKLLNESN